jgi:hypothetical protein
MDEVCRNLNCLHTSTLLKTDLPGSQLERASSLGSKQARSIVRRRRKTAMNCSAAH